MTENMFKESFDYYNSNIELESLVGNSRQGLLLLSNLKVLFQNIQTHFETFYTETRISLENYYAEQIKIDCRSTSSKATIDLYVNYDEYLVKLRSTIAKIERDVIDPITLFYQQISTIYAESLGDYKHLISSVNDLKKNIETQKFKYHECCKAVIDKENSILKVYSNKKNSELDLTIANDSLLKVKSAAEINSEQYKYELIKFNSKVEDYENRYQSIIKVLKSNEESRIFFVKCHLEKFSKIFEEYTISGFDLINRINTSNSDISVVEDIKLFNERYQNVKTRFPKENFISYESYKLDEKYSETQGNQLSVSPNSLTIHSNNSRGSYFGSNFFSDFDIINQNEIPMNEFSESYFTNIVNKFLINLYSEQEVNVDSIGKIINFINYDYCNKSGKNSMAASNNFSKQFIDSVLSDKKTIYLHFQNFENLKHFANILNTITINIDDMNSENYDLNYAIIFIAGRSFYRKDNNKFIEAKKMLPSPYIANINNISKNNRSNNNNLKSEIKVSNFDDTLNNNDQSGKNNKDKETEEERIKKLSRQISENKVYLSALLSLNKLYSSRSFWMDLIELKIARKIEETMRKSNINNYNITNSSNKKQNTSETNNNSTNANNTTMNYSAYNQYQNSSIISSVGSKLKGLFKGAKTTKHSNLNNTNTNNNMNNQNRENSTNFTRDNLLENLTYVSESVKYLEASSVLKDFIVYFANFNLEVTEAMNIIVEIASKYNFPKERISLYVTLLNSYSFTVKNQLPANMNKSLPKEKRLNNELISSTSMDKKIESLYRSHFYLRSKELPNIICLNQETLTILAKKIYKLKLSNLDALNIDERLRVWKTILQVTKLKNQYNYKEYLSQLPTDYGKEKNSINDIINLDVARTFFDYNAEQARKSICNILKVLAIAKPDINYCQGMNYIASFIYHLCNDEEETFYILLGLFNSTEYKSMFLDDLKRLKQLFYVFDRLLTLTLPEINNYMKLSSITCNYFSSAWFITLFTNSYQFKTAEEHPKILIRLWDSFILYGWETLMRAGITLLKMNEEDLLVLRYEELLHYLINDLIKKCFYVNSNYEHFESIFNYINFKEGMLSNIENESIQERRLKEIDDSYCQRLNSNS